MAVSGSSNENSVASRKFIGLENFRVVGVNPPTAKVWQDLGFNFEKEPEYTSQEEDDQGNKYNRVRLDFVLNNAPEEGEPEINVIHSIYIDTRRSKSKTDKGQYCNKYGQFAWLPSLSEVPENMDWFNTEGARESFKNEELLIDFLRNYANVSKAMEVGIEHFFPKPYMPIELIGTVKNKLKKRVNYD